MIRRIVRVRGRVQGVGFRMSAAMRAEQLGVTGTVRNLFDGTVEADVEGEDDAVEAMVAWLRSGPPSAAVERVDVREDTPRGASSFRVTG
ncbi:acylphosphatase [Brachybacterium huguangmaarense]|uniref:acylphosphatase n=1 Tax=Brachybacterium huguangmaarense TaxID=1652028 RepID=A0ABY6G0Y7_9MICO|nr:acylphosphatase [Brachybacterium huguangmaarense]UYG16855.1 acylphosphatase [Brachybacterium huguangmaarense]